MLMESSWNCDSGDKGFVLSNETVSPADSLTARSKNVLMNWESKGSTYSYDNSNLLFPSQKQALENQGILEVGFPDMIRKQSSHDSLRNVLSSHGSGGGDVITMHTITSNAISGDEESSSRLSNSVVDSNSRESSLIDLKLGRLVDNLNYNSTTTAPIWSSTESSTPAKRVKASSLNSQPAFCQVFGCNKDLSSSKDYHKRHKVCDVHSKTAKVIVNGVEQRFCQQCSRFHLLGEFDDGKRSCRRRLAGHNERRRKPQVGLHSTRTGRLIHPYNGCGGTRPNGATMTTSLICQDMVPSSIVPQSDKCSVINLSKHVKLEHEPYFASKLSTSWTDGQLLQKPMFPPYGLIGKQGPFSPNVNGTTTTAAGVFHESNLNQYHPQDTSSCPLFHNSLFDTASTVQGLPELSESGCALSLLSSQPHNSPSHNHHPSGIPSTEQPFMIPGNGSHHSFDVSGEVSGNLFGVGSLDLHSGVSSRYGPVVKNQLNPVSLSNGNASTVRSDFTGGYFNGLKYVNVKDGPSPDDGATIDLLQLSTQLQRVEQQRQAVPVKQEDDTFCCLRIT